MLSAAKDTLFLYCNVRASQSIHENKNLWIAVKNINETDSEILSAWCSCMAGAYEATLKVEYANNKGWCNPACTGQACVWNKCTKQLSQKG